MNFGKFERSEFTAVKEWPLFVEIAILSNTLQGSILLFRPPSLFPHQSYYMDWTKSWLFTALLYSIDLHHFSPIILTTWTEPKVDSLRLYSTLKHLHHFSPIILTTRSEPKVDSLRLYSTLKHLHHFSPIILTTRSEPKVDSLRLYSTLKHLHHFSPIILTTWTEPKVDSSRLYSTLKDLHHFCPIISTTWPSNKIDSFGPSLVKKKFKFATLHRRRRRFAPPPPARSARNKVYLCIWGILKKEFFQNSKIDKNSFFQNVIFTIFAKVLKFSGIFSKNLVPLESSHP